jgi:hypothetical protein
MQDLFRNKLYFVFENNLSSEIYATASKNIQKPT